MKLISYVFLFVCAIGYTQTVTIDDTGNTGINLANTLLDNACVEVSNATMSSEESVAFFNNNGGEFPISKGVIIRSGKAKFSEGQYTGEGMSSELNELSDPYLEEINNASGQSPLITDVAFLEFDFVPLSSNFNFDFLFASNEYGEWQCVSSDVFAFMLTDLTTGETSNLAVIPDTDMPVSVRNIKDSAYNGSCEPDHPELFGKYETDNPSSSSLNMRGYTQVMNASAEITPGNSYRIRLVIGDSNDSNFDSAIFLSAGSFNTNVNLGEDRFFCQGDEDKLYTGLDVSTYQHTWTYNGKVIPGETSNSLQVKAEGTYGVRVTKSGSSCLAMDEVVFSNLEVQQPEDIRMCHTGSESYNFDLLTNGYEALGINGDLYDVFYYRSYNSLKAETPIPANQLSAFSSKGNQTIFIKIFNKKTERFCDAVYDFKLLVNDPVEIIPPGSMQVCRVPGKNFSMVDVTVVQEEILDERDPEAYSFSYYNSEEDARLGKNPILDPTKQRIHANISTKEFWIRFADSQGCFAVTGFEVNINPLPPVDELDDVEQCESYILPELTHGNYFTGRGGTGTALFAGDVIEESGMYFIFNGPDANSCSNESSFEVKLIGQYGINENYCGLFTVPVPPTGAFYTAPGGPQGPGKELISGLQITSSQTIYFYAEVDGSFCRDEAFKINIIPLPEVDTPQDVVTCGNFELPPLEFGDYFTTSNGNGKKLEPGDIIDSSTELYIFSKEGACTNEHSFNITIIPEFQNVISCGSYELPVPEVGSYYTEALGQGEEIRPGSTIDSTQTVFFYAETTTSPNCTANTSFEILINPIPEVDELADVLLCEAEEFVLPEIENGWYFTEPNREGERLFAGDIIAETTTIYINNLDNDCTSETEFLVEIRPLPNVENFTDIYSCAAYQLPKLRHGTYYTGPGMTGEQLEGGEIITTTQTLYIYKKWEDLDYCFSEKAFTVYIEGIDVGEFDDVSVCDSYTLPQLAEGDYYTQSGGRGEKYTAGYEITGSQQIFVYAQQGKRFICQDEKSFYVQVSKTPKLQSFKAIESCGSYTLPDLSNEEYNVSYHWEPGGEAEINSLVIAAPGKHTVYVYAWAKNNPDCIDEAQFDVTIYPLLDLKIKENALCRNPETGEVESPAMLYSGLNPEEFEVYWFLNDKLVHVGPEYAASQAGEYEVETLKLQPEKGAFCNYKPTTVKVKESSQPEIKATVTEAFADVAVINVEIVKGYGEYEYQLNGGEFQYSNQFYNVSSGTHTVKVRGLLGDCGETVLKVEVLKFPKFFTPNDDGFHETWNIPDLKSHHEAEISIFDRYGKLLTVIKANGPGWDGRFNGREMPSNDYWFKVNFQKDGELKEFSSHFSLVRTDF